MRRSSGSRCDATSQGGGCGAAVTSKNVDRRGVLWIMGAFLICPCHLPLTLWLAGALLGGTALGAALRGHALVAGTVITLSWLAATGYGFHLLRAARTIAARAQRLPPLLGGPGAVGSQAQRSGGTR